jgi:sugar lactone lactonase YvrE
MTHRRILLLGLVTALSLAIAPAVSAHGGFPHPTPLPTRIDLPDGFQPEGMTSGPANKLYVGSLADGAIWKGSARTGTGSILVPGVSGQMATGVHLDWRGRLWVAGATNGTIRVYSSRTGALLKEYAFQTAGFVNDLVITHRAVYATDSVNQQLLVMPIGKHGKLLDASQATFKPLNGDIVYGAGFNANGIVAQGRWLILVQSNTGKLFRVDPRTGATKAIDTHGYSLLNGDGLLLRGRTLFVVRNTNDLVAALHLSKRLTSARLIKESTSPSLDVPTAATFAVGKLWVVNARFGVADPTTAQYWISRLRFR